MRRLIITVFTVVTITFRLATALIIILVGPVSRVFEALLLFSTWDKLGVRKMPPGPGPGQGLVVLRDIEVEKLIYSLRDF